jgi:hypothetical protein
MKKYYILLCAIMLCPFVLASTALSRTNSLTAGATISYDYYDRRGSETPGDDGQPVFPGDSDDDYNRLSLTPLLRYASTGERDSIELTASPSLRYELDDSEFEWDNYLSLVGERAFSQFWQVRGSNRFSRSDYSSDETVFSDGSDTDLQDSGSEPELSSDLGRTRYWRNTLDLASEFQYRQDSLFFVGFNWTVLRNDDDFRSSDDYDRYGVTLRDEHRFDIRWRSVAEFSAVRGDFQEADDILLSEDLWEYYLFLSLENNSIERNPLFLSYDYIAVKYDDTSQFDDETHQLRLTWRHDASPHLYTILGGGPSYLKPEEGDDSWGYNGIAEVNYLLERGSYRFAVEKGYTADNFSGTDERGIIDFWDAGLSFSRLLTQELSLDGLLGYRWEERTSPTLEDGFEEYSEERYRASLGLSYRLSQYLSTRLSYSFISQDSDREGDDYDDHRLLLSLSWEQELLRW